MMSTRYKVIYGSYDGVEKKAVEQICAAISPFVSYTLTVKAAEITTADELKDIHPVFVGTPASNRYIRSFIEKGLIQPLKKEESYFIKITKSIFNPEHQMIIITGYDQNGVLYGGVDFNSYGIPAAENNFNHHTYFDKIFSEKQLPEYERSSAPAIKDRGLWTWGHVIYDYKGYIDNMMRLKMNTLIIWNDYVPVNIRDVIEYAHGCGVKIICGYAWGWDNLQFQSDGFDISNPEYLQKVEDDILEKYEQDYSKLDIDGIYFQSFTETEQESVNGHLIADIVVQLVNRVAKKLFNRYGEMDLLFGLHATSVAQKLEYIKNTDKRVHIVWEDCGAFPYSYLPSNVEGFDKALTFTDEITALRGKDEKFGAVLKGLICLNWNIFEHQNGEFVMGCSSKEFIARRAMEKEKIWRFVNSYWLENISYAKELIKRIAANTGGNANVTALVEDGMFEFKIPLPVALMGELLWDSDIPAGDLLQLVAQRRDISLE